MLGGPPEHSAIDNIHRDILLLVTLELFCYFHDDKIKVSRIDSEEYCLGIRIMPLIHREMY